MNDTLAYFEETLDVEAIVSLRKGWAEFWKGRSLGQLITSGQVHIWSWLIAVVI